MAWIKRTTPVEPPKDTENAVVPTEDTVPEQPATPEEQPTPNTQTPTKKSRRYSKHGARRGHFRGTAVLGFFVLFFALVGVVATVWGGVHVLRRMRDTSYLKDDMYYSLLPLMQYAPDAFDSVDTAQQDLLVRAALYQITNREWIRQQQDATYVTPYETDDFGRAILPAADVTQEFKLLFGAEHTPDPHAFGSDASSFLSYEYDAEKKVYYVPTSSSVGSFEPVIDTIQRAGETYTVRVGYVHLTDITVDDYGNRVIDIEKATYYQLYTVEQVDDRFVIRAIADEKATP